MHTTLLVLIEVLIVIGLSRIMGQAFRLINQPLVIGEIIAGIMLGPSLFGLIAPDVATMIFPQETLPFLEVLSSIGLVFFMFLIGLELNPQYLKSQLDIAILVSHVSILVPFCLGSLLAILLYPLVSYNEISFTAFALFLGAAMSITAFPVLARIITENNLQRTKLGTLALTCAAVDDVTAWCLLALAIAVTRTNSMTAAIPTIAASLVYIAFMFLVGRWLLQKVELDYERRGKLTQIMLAIIYMVVVISALITEVIGIHLIFGAFLVGAVMPKNERLVRDIAEKTEDFVLIFLLPVFFAFSGLRTQIGLLNRPELWLLCGLVLLVAIAGKYIGTYIAARVCGINNQEAAALGWLMNTRGLTELIVLNIGLSFGVISPLLFTMLVIMALATTFMTSPLLEWTYPKKLIELDVVEEPIPTNISEQLAPKYRILVPVANPSTQQGLIKLASAIAGSNRGIVNPLNLIELAENYLYESTPDEANRTIKQRQASLGKLIDSLEPPEIRSIIHPIVQVTNDVAKTTNEIALNQKVDLVLVGWHRPAFSTNRLGGRVGRILKSIPKDVAVFVNKESENWENLLVAYGETIHDDLSLSLALRMLFNNPHLHLKILSFAQVNQTHSRLTNESHNMIELLPESLRSRIEMTTVEQENSINAVIQESRYADLTIAGTSRSWGIERQTLGYYTDRLAQNCHSSLLVTRCYAPITNHITSLLEESSQQPLEISSTTSDDSSSIA